MNAVGFVGGQCEGVSMFLVEDRRPGFHNFVFTYSDPRQDGYSGAVIEGASLNYDMDAIHNWPDGERMPDPQMGRDPKDSNHYQVFKFPEQLRRAGYEFVHDNTPIVVPRWRNYLKMVPSPADVAKKADADEWFDYLDATDAAEKQRRQKDIDPEPPPGSAMEQVAEWIAQQHLGASGSLRRVVYLPAGAPPDEIRLIEVSERFEQDFDQVEPFDFGAEVAGKRYKIVVVDVTGEQLDTIRSEPNRLPPGWNLSGAREFKGWRDRRQLA